MRRLVSAESVDGSIAANHTAILREGALKSLVDRQIQDESAWWNGAATCRWWHLDRGISKGTFGHDEHRTHSHERARLTWKPLRQIRHPESGQYRQRQRCTEPGPRWNTN